MSGPNRQYLDAGLDEARTHRVVTASDNWRTAGNQVSLVARALYKAAHAGSGLGGQTGEAMFAAMMASSKRLGEHVEQMGKGVVALDDAQEAIQQALDARGKIDSDLPPYEKKPYKADPEDTDADTVNKKAMHENAETTAAATREERREQRARHVAETFEKRFEHPIKVMQDIYGYEPPTTTEPKVDNGIGTPTRGGYQSPPTVTQPPWHPPKQPPTIIDEPPTCTGYPPPEPPTTTTTTPPVPPETPVGYPPSEPPAPPVPPTPVPTSPDFVSGGNPGSGGGVPVGLIGAGAGAAGVAGLVGGLVRGGVIGPGSLKLPGGVAPIGGTARGGPGTLGGTAPGARGGSGVGGAGTRGAGTRGSGTGGAGSRGGRGSGAGAGAGGRGRGKSDRENGSDRDLFDDGDEWLDDDGSTGVLD